MKAILFLFLSLAHLNQFHQQLLFLSKEFLSFYFAFSPVLKCDKDLAKLCSKFDLEYDEFKDELKEIVGPSDKDLTQILYLRKFLH